MESYLDLIIVGVFSVIGTIIAVLTRRNYLTKPPAVVVAVPSKAQNNVEKNADTATKQAEEEKNKALITAKQQHDVGVDKQAKELESRKDALISDPDELNKQLLDVGKQVRDGV